MEADVLDGRMFNGFTISVALVSALIAAVALFYGRRAIFPPARRITIFIYTLRRAAETHSSLDLYSTVVTIGNTGRYAVESARFDRDRPLVIDLGAPVRHVNMIKAPRSDMCLKLRGSTVTFGPDLLNSGETITAEIQTVGAVICKLKNGQGSHVLIDTAVDAKWRRPPGRVRRYAPRIALLLPLIYLLTVGIVNGQADVVSYLVSGPSASISPDHGPSSGCVTIRGENYAPDEKIEVITYDFPPESYSEYPAPEGCPALVHGRGVTKSSIKGEVLFSFALPSGCSGMLTIWVEGDHYDAVTYWVM
jgi:hypothetical protein